MNSSDQPSIVVRGVSKRFRRRTARASTLQEMLLRGFWQKREAVEDAPFWALRDISFSLPQGAMVGVVGTNGAGKTTLLRIVGGVIRPDAGTVSAPRRVGALELGSGFHPDLTGRESVIVGGVIAGLTRRGVAARFDEIVAFSELGDVIDNPLRTYSTGMRMRLAFAVAAHVNPEVLLVDEVLAVGDARFQRKCLERVTELRSAGCTILLVSHDTSLIARLCDVALLLESGSLAAQGPAGEIVDRYLRGSMGTPAEAQASRLRQGGNRFGSGDVEITGVQIRNGVGDPVNAIRTGDALAVRMHWSLRKPVEGMKVGVLITRAEDGVACCDLTTTARPEDETAMDLCIDRLDLSPGAYFADIGIYSADGASILDYHWNVYTFMVESPEEDIPLSHTHKPVLVPPHRWSPVESGSAD